jgi:alkanesulfonate monooxygenase SsuD/methylene tetrahydromethanopterin reductase-like flavin-dependent oxidoreductase (luciferase family)
LALRDALSFGMALPARSPDPIDMQAMRETAQVAEAAGFSDLWVTDNSLDHVYSLDAIVALTYTAAVTTSIRVGVSVVVSPLVSPIHLAHQVTSLDVVSGGRAIIGVGIGRTDHYEEYQVPSERRVRRFLEGIRVMKALWTEPKAVYKGEIYQLRGTTMGLKPVQKPHPPLWLGGGHPDAVRRAAVVADAWMGAGGQSTVAFKESVPILKAALEKAGRDPASFPISKRIFMSVHDDASVARAEVHRWFSEVYRNPEQTDTNGVHGTPEQVKERLEEFAAAGATHLLLNPVTRHAEQAEALASIVGLK